MYLLKFKNCKCSYYNTDSCQNRHKTRNIVSIAHKRYPSCIKQTDRLTNQKVDQFLFLAYFLVLNNNVTISRHNMLLTRHKTPDRQSDSYFHLNIYDIPVPIFGQFSCLTIHQTSSWSCFFPWIVVLNQTSNRFIRELKKKLY